MKINVNTGKRTPQMRILSAFMAFLIFSLAFCEIIGSFGLIANAITEGQAISSTTITSTIASITGLTDDTGRTDDTYTYRYNGKMVTSTVKLFDYLSDSEIPTGSPSQTWDGGYSNPYDRFNMAVSDTILQPTATEVDSNPNDNFTITFTPSGNIVDNVYVYMWSVNDSEINVPWPGQKMYFDEVNRVYKYTYNTTNPSSPYYIGFVPQHLIFSKKGSHQTEDIDIKLTPGQTYAFDNNGCTNFSGIKFIYSASEDKGDVNIYLWNDNGNFGAGYPGKKMRKYQSGNRYYYELLFNENSIPTKYILSRNNGDDKLSGDDKVFNPQPKNGDVYIFYSGGSLPEGSPSRMTHVDSEKTYQYADKYYAPLYFGAFWMSNDENEYTSTNKPGLADGKSGGPYQNFFWKPNISLKDNTGNYSADMGKVVVQRLVGDNLSGAVSTGELLQNGKVLPYFSESWAEDNSNVMKYYNKDDTNGKGISFPFYEVTIPAEKGTGYTAGDNSSNGDIAKYYQFNSAKNNLYFKKGSTDHTGHFLETALDDYINGDDAGGSGNKGRGFFPFNTSSTDPKNYGFGARFDMPFHLTADGKVSALDSNGKEKSSLGRVNTRFEFTGDDDMWIFIDGHLVLDLGGVHDATSGYIDFTERKAVAKDAVKLDDGGSKDELYDGLTVSERGPKDTFTYNSEGKINDWVAGGNEFTSLLNGNNTATTYDTNEPHTMTIFYMERGMFDSNLMIRFNFPVEPNFNKFKIREETNFSSINPGLVDLTKQAAKDDVFMYTIQNKGTDKEHVIDGTALYPSQVNNIRDDYYLTSENTPFPAGSTESKSYNFQPDNKDNYFNVGEVSYNWVDEFADNDGMKSINHVAGRTNTSGQLFLMYGTSDKKSSAEFEGQFDRYSKMKVAQIAGNDMLYKPVVDPSNPTNAVTFSPSTRKISDYYSSDSPYIFTKYSRKNGYTGTGVVNGNLTVANGAEFDFRSDIGSSALYDADGVAEVQMTEYFTNVPNTGGITIKKLLPTDETVIPSDKTSFTIKVRFEDIFDVSTVDADDAGDYTGIKYNVYNSDNTLALADQTMGSSTMTVGGQTKACGTISLGVGQWATIAGIPYKTKYIIDENETYYAPNVTNDDANVTSVLTGTIDGTTHLAATGNNITVTNFSHSLTIKEVTDFSTVNRGLLTYTKKAAENDVFKYTVSNSGTTDNSEDTHDSGIKTPTYDQYVRNSPVKSSFPLDSSSLTTNLTNPDYNYIYLDTSKILASPDLKWSSDNAVIGAYIYNRKDQYDQQYTVVGTKVEEDLYRFPLKLINGEVFGRVQFIRYKSNVVIPSPFYYGGLYNGDIYDIQKSTALTAGATYKIDAWNNQQPSKSIDPKPRYEKYETHNYTPSVSGTKVANANYEWVDQYAERTGTAPFDTIDGMTGTTSNNGEFYLMYGTVQNATGQTDNKESSATFYNQFARGSTMTVEPSTILNSPNRTPDPDKLDGEGQRTDDTLSKYYTTTKALEGGIANAPDDDDKFTYNNNTTGLTNSSIHITETFTNAVNVGTLKITKEINPTETDPDSKNTTMKNAVFKFRIKLTKVFGVDGNDVSNSGTATYSGITVSRSGTGNENYTMTNYTDVTDPNNPVYYGEFELKQGETLTIEKIPYNTHYEIQEVGQTGANPYYVFNSVKSTTDNSTTWSTPVTSSATVSGDIVADQTKEFKYANKRKVGSLTLTKTITGQTNSTVKDNTLFYFTVTLKEPVGVTFAGNYTDITGFGSATKSASADEDGCYTYTFSNISVKKEDGAKTIIENIPYGTYYTVTEVDHTTNPHAIYDNDTRKTFASGYIGTSSAVANATVNNVYRKVEMTKTDAQNSDKKIDGAKYVLLKLNRAFTNVYENGTPQEKDDLAELFAGATAENYTTTLASYLTSDSSGELITGWNGTAYTGTGTVSVNDVTMEHSLTDGYYFFFETSPATDYEVDNSLTSGKLIKIDINDTSSTYSKAAGIYTDPRKTGDLVLKKAISTDSVDTYPKTEFTYNVRLSVSESGVKLTDYLSQEYLEGLDGIVKSTISRADALVTFQIKVKEGDTNKVTIEGLPFGTTYSVTEDEKTGWKQISTNPSGTIGIGNSGTDYILVHNDTTGKYIPTYTATITNVRVGSLELVKNIAEGTDAEANKAVQFTYTVTLEHTDSNIKLKDFIKNAQISGVESLDADHYNDSHIEVEISVSKQTSVTINNIPYGTTYSVSESDTTDWSKKTPVAADYSGTITSSSTVTDAKTATFTNAKTGSLVLKKDYSGESEAITAANVTGGTDFTFTVTLKGTANLSLGDYLGKIKRSDYNESDENTHLTIINIGNGQYRFTVPVSKESPKTIVGLPYGTTYTVTETRPSYPNTVTHTVNDEVTTFTQNSAISSTPSEVEIKNVYATSTPPTPVTSSLTVTKTDLSGNAIKSSPATYYLLKLNSTFDADYENDPAALSNTFKNAASPSYLSQYYSGGYYGPKQTDSSGQVVFTDSDLTITAGDKFFFFEAQAPYGYAIDNSLTYVDSSGNTHSKILSVTAADTNPTAVYPNPNTTGVSVYKTNEYGEGLENGEFDLYYKQNNTTTPPPTYSYNKPETPPVPEATTKINRNNLTVPDDAAGTSSVTTYTYEYSYPFEPSMPSSTEEDWILPRSDNDYIYFRDYNTGTINSKDTEAFYYQDSHNNDKRYWINTWLDNNEFGQNEEVGYDHRYKLKAQFTKNGSDFKEYEAWERFVDIYTDSANNVTRKTVVWKIQPPDGYNKVRFCLYDGGQCIRTTQEFSYVLGNIYTKTNRGSGTDNKWDYPVTGEHWSTNWNGTGAGQSDKRMSYSTFYGTNGAATRNAGVNTNHYVYNDTQNATSNQQAPEQTQRYTATEQKIVFQCNSKQVWHNIHIEFFSSDSESARIGQGFPGYMMEPYAFAGNDYRLKGYLTYELTIPKGATHFRINNGVSSGNFAYKTKITPLSTNTFLNNYGNFFKFPTTPQNGSYNTVDLRQWTKTEIQNAGDKYYATYNTAEVESDYDYIYFKLPSGSGWSNHVYAYFYGGGDLRAHNWQRGVYSIWPGVAPVATEYSATGNTTQHSDHYTYEYTQTLFSETPTNAGSITGINPESTFQYDGGTVYKFKIPKSERVTYENNGKRVYDKVIFNDGFKKYSANTSTSSNNETGMIGFKAGYIYSPDDTKGKKYYGDATNNYTGRGDYLYINNAADWDNLHVTFYDANGTAIWQGGTGYIMQYEGTKDGKKYYRIPIPSCAAKFKLNNGKGSGQTSAMGVIYPKQNDVDTSKKDYTTGDMIYTLNADKSLEKIYPIFNAPQQVSHTSSSTTLQASGVNYVTRGDKLYIRNTANWSGMNIGAVKVKFYDSSNAVIGTLGTYTMIVSETESASVASDNRTNGTGSSTAAKWYSIDIPMNAAEFQLTSPVSTAQYDIYERINSDGSTDRNYKWTKGDMYYETSGTNALTLLYPTYYQSVDYTATDNYGTGNARGDNLYLVVSDLDKWENMRVTFYDENGAAIKNTANDTAIVPNYIGYKNYSPTNSEAVGYWFKIAIPTDAVSFRATSSTSNSESGDIYELSQNRTYHFRNDYTPGDMQYRITDTLSGGTYNLSLMYPIFTEEPFYSLNDEVNNSYPTNNITIPTPTSGTNDAPVLYPTSSNTIQYTWQEGGSSSVPDNKIRFDNSSLEWDTVYAHFWGSSGNLNSGGGGFPGNAMTEESGGIWSITVPIGATGLIFSNGSSNHKTANIDLTLVTDGGKNQKYKPTVKTNSGASQVWWTPCSPYTNNQYIHFYDSGKSQIAWTNQSGGSHSDGYDPDLHTGQGYNNQNSYGVNIPSGAVYVRCEMHEGDPGYWTDYIALSSFNPRTEGIYASGCDSSKSGEGKIGASYNTYTLPNALRPVRDIQNGAFEPHTVYTSGSQPVEKTATYQPEDRYGYIANVTSMQDYASSFNSSPTTDNFVKVNVTGIDIPYIQFYDANDTLITFTSTSDVTNAVGLKVTKMTVGSTDYTGVAQASSPYTIRIPKGAKKIRVGDGTNWSSLIALYTGYTNEFTASKSGTTVSISQSTSTSRSTNSATIQSGVTDDSGFIFYKGNMTHAYYYGGVDGEFCAWPGVPYSYTYTDGSDKVYAFQIPTTSGSTSKVYPYVIFNDGTANSGTNMTVAINYAGKEIYQDSNASGAYGSWSAAPKTVTRTTKTTPTPQGDLDDTPPEYTEIHLATIVTGADGKQKYIKWLKPKPGAEDEVDTEYLDHVFSDIGKDAKKKEVRVKKLGEYYWVETVAPAGYKAVKDKIGFTLTTADTAAGSYITHIVDEPLPGKVLLMKTAKEKVGNTDIGDALLGAKFKLTTKADLNTAIKAARKTDKSEYYVIPDISVGATDDSKEEYIALSNSGEYETISDTVTLTVPDPDNEGQTKNVTVQKLKEYIELITDENGYIKIENLVWGDYVLTETAAPNGYAAATNGMTNTITFTVGKNNSDITQKLSLKDEMNPAYIKLFEHINERKDAWGDPTFTFRIKQTHEYIHTYDDINDTWTDTLTEIPDYLQKEVLVSLTVNDDGTGTNVLASSVTTTNFTDWLVESTDEMKDSKREYQGMYHIDSQGRIRVEPGTYEITRMPISRYEFVTSAYTNQYDNGGTAGSQNENLDNSSKPLEKVNISGLEAGKTIDVHYYDKVGYYDKFSQVDTKINKFYTLDSNKNNTTVKGIRIDDYYVADSGTVSGDTLTVDTSATATFKAYKIMADGTEQQITDSTELAKLAITYTYDSSSKDDERFGHQADTSDNDFSYSNSTITVDNVSRYHDSVYKLNVSYDNKFTTTFNLVFEKQSTNVTYYTAQVIFKNDSQDSTSHDPSNISYFEESGNRTHAYEFTFVIADDNGTKTVSDIRHNGTSVGTGDTAWSSALSTMNSSFNILSGYSYSLNSWVQLAPSSPSLTDYNSIDTYLKGLTPTDGKADSIEFAAHLTSS